MITVSLVHERDTPIRSIYREVRVPGRWVLASGILYLNSDLLRAEFGEVPVRLTVNLSATLRSSPRGAGT